MATLIGTPPNALLAGFMAETYGITIGFAQWMLVGVPLASVLLGLCWLLLTRVLYRVGREERPEVATAVRQTLQEMDALTRPEKLVALVFMITASLWVLRPLLASFYPDGSITDTGIAIACALLLFVIPVDHKQGIYLMDWKSAEKLPWGVLLLFGGGLSLAAMVAHTGLAAWLGSALAGLAGHRAATGSDRSDDSADGNGQQYRHHRRFPAPGGRAGREYRPEPPVADHSGRPGRQLRLYDAGRNRAQRYCFRQRTSPHCSDGKGRIVAQYHRHRLDCRTRSHRGNQSLSNIKPPSLLGRLLVSTSAA
jgi:hypothetical protein